MIEEIRIELDYDPGKFSNAARQLRPVVFKKGRSLRMRAWR